MTSNSVGCFTRSILCLHLQEEVHSVKAICVVLNVGFLIRINITDHTQRLNWNDQHLLSCYSRHLFYSAWVLRCSYYMQNEMRICSHWQHYPPMITWKPGCSQCMWGQCVNGDCHQRTVLWIYLWITYTESLNPFEFPIKTRAWYKAM